MRLSLFVFVNLLLAAGAAFIMAGDLEEWAFFFMLVFWPSLLVLAFVSLRSILTVIASGGWAGCLSSAFLIFDLVASAVLATMMAGDDVGAWVIIFLISLLIVPVIVVGLLWQLILGFVRAATLNHPGG